jgi:hypothetical protein
MLTEQAEIKAFTVNNFLVSVAVSEPIKRDRSHEIEFRVKTSDALYDDEKWEVVATHIDGGEIHYLIMCFACYPTRRRS